MDVHNTIGGSLQISTEVIAKIARLAALEVDGVADVATGSSQNVRGLLGRTGLQKPVTVVMEDGIATVTVHLTAVYGSKIMPLCEKVQENVKQTIQNMTGITVSRVDVLVVGLTEPPQPKKSKRIRKDRNVWKKKLTRRESRETAFLTAFAATFEPEEPTVPAEDHGRTGCIRHQPAGRHERPRRRLDEIITAHLKGWTLARVPRVSLVALRLALAEMLYGDEQKPGVAINEAVELVKKYGADNDYQFVNGLLGAVARERGESPRSAAMLTLGIDTSNYATSLAVFDTNAGEVVCDCKKFLPVKAGQLGLRQSDALFHHTAALPAMLAELGSKADLTQIGAVGVSARPRPVEGSYMPCFLAGVSAATAFCAGQGHPADSADPPAGAYRRGAVCGRGT